MKENLQDGATPFQDDKNLYGKKINPTPIPPREIGIDTDDSFYDTIIAAAESDKLDGSALDSFNMTSRSRDEVYSLIDTMCQDISVAAVLETYAEDATEMNDSGKIVWVDSADADVSKYITYLLNSMKVDKNVYAWVHSLCKYGDLYLRIYRESEYNDQLFDKKQLRDIKKKNRLIEEISLDSDLDSQPERMDEAVKIKAYKKDDHFVHYLEMQPNPATVFELTKFGKSYAYIKTDPQMTSTTGNGFSPSLPTTGANYLQFNNYRFNKGDITVYAATEFVHGCLEDDTNRTPEEVTIVMGDDETNTATYKVKRGKSLFYDLFKIWREMTLLENAILLNRVTKSSVVRAIGVEIGDMPKEQVQPHLQGVKRLFEQSESIISGKSMSEYTNPGPIENNVYIPTRDGKGAINIQQVGGDVDVKGLADLDYFRDKFFGGLKVPKQYFGFTEDGAGFDGGKSLSIISSRYAKMVKRIQNTIIQTLTDAINIILLDRGLANYINKFQLKMQAPTTQEDIDRRENMSAKVQLTRDTMDMVTDIEDPITKLKILKALISNYLTDTEVIELLQTEIEKLEAEKEAEENPPEPEEEESVEEVEEESSEEPVEEEEPGSLSAAIDMGGIEDEGEGEGEEDIVVEESLENLNEDDNILPTPASLGLDFSDNTNFR